MMISAEITFRSVTSLRMTGTDSVSPGLTGVFGRLTATAAEKVNAEGLVPLNPLSAVSTTSTQPSPYVGVMHTI